MQFTVNTLIAGCTYALVGCGFGLVYRVQRFFFISHGLSLLCAGYLFYWLVQRQTWPLLLAVPAVVIATVVLAVSVEIGLFARLRGRKASALTMFIASTSLLVLGQNLLLWQFGPGVRTITFGNPILDIQGAAITVSQCVLILSAFILIPALSAFLRFLRVGTLLRALSESEPLARACGLPVERLYTLTHALAGAFGAIAGILVATELDVRFTSGFAILFKGMIAAILGGIGSVAGSLFGGIFLAFVENASVLFLPTGLKDAVAAVVFVTLLLFRGKGFVRK